MQKQNKKFYNYLILLIFIASSICANGIKQLGKVNNYLREGPAVYYSLVSVLPKGEKVQIIKTDKKWSQIRTKKGQQGWISNKSFHENKSNDYSDLANKWASLKVSKISLAGAIKGLLGKSGETNQGDFNRLLKLTESKLTSFQISNFENELNLYKSENRDEVDFDDADLELPEFEPSLQDQQVGFGIAARIANNPMIVNMDVRQYLYSIMYALLEKSEFYDYEFNVLLLNDNNPDGFSCPGGFIFITSGVFNICRDESELAAAIAHELGHELLQHGSKELKNRKVQMNSDDLFAEMDEEIEESNTAELDKQIADSYELTVKYRTLPYEKEADKLASILLANAGYDPFAIGRLTKRLANLYIAEKDVFNENYLAPNEMQARAIEINNFLNDNFSKENPGARLTNRFYNNKMLIE